MKSPPQICLISSVPGFFWHFYRQLPERLKEAGFDVEICSSPMPELELLKDYNDISVHGIEFLRQISPIQDLKSLYKLVKLFRKKRYDIVHLHSPKASLLGMIAGLLTRTKCRIYTCHGLPAETEKGIKRWLLLSCEKLTFALATKVLVVSQSLSAKVAQFKLCRSSKMEILGDGTACGINLQRFNRGPDVAEKVSELRKQFAWTNGEFVVGFVGRLVPDKGIHVLVDVFKDVVRDHPDVRLLIIGDYEKHRGLLPERTSNEIENNPMIRHIDYTDQIEEYYAMMDMLVLPTRREGFPYTLLEAAAMQVPVISTKVTGCLDAVVDQVTGLLIPPDSPDMLKQAISNLIEDQPLRSKMASAARERVEQKFYLERYIQLHLKLYSAQIEA